MCGIVGIVRIGERPLPPRDTLERMAGAIVHRGPDGFGDFRDRWVHIGAVRLSVLDVNRGNQPALNAQRTIASVYNGELYNFGTLGAELRADGCFIESTGDTALLPYLYEKYGDRLVERLTGMFAFAIWDRRVRVLYLYRDRIGIKPLFFACTPDYVLFASEIKALFASGLLVPEIDREALDDLFSLSYPCPPRTMFARVEELRPAHILRLQAGRRKIKITRYWRAPFLPRGAHKRRRRRELAAEFRERLREKVATHLVADVKVGTYLSSGLDSSAITALTRSLDAPALDAFTIAFPGDALDEAGAAQSQALVWQLRHHVVRCGPEIAALFADSIYHTEIPLQYPLALPFMKLSAAVRHTGTKVILTGEGADELLAGYDCFRLEKIRRLLDRPLIHILKPAIYARMFGWLGSPAGIAEFFLKVQARPAAEIEREFGGIRPPWYDIWNALDTNDRTPLLAVEGHAPRPIHRAPANFRQLVREDVAELHPLDAALSLEIETRLPCWTVLVDDRASMANSIETRVPFLDHEFVEWVTQLPPECKLRGIEEKSILREAMRGVLPDTIRRRKKRPFYSPIRQWFFSAKRPDFVDELLGSKRLQQSGLFDPAVVRRMEGNLASAPEQSLVRHQLEWLLILVLGTQVLHDRFVARLSDLTDPALCERARRLPPMTHLTMEEHGGERYTPPTAF